MTKNYAYNRMEKAVTEMTDGEVIGYREWVPFFTINQMRQQIEWEQSPNFKRVAC